VKIPVLAGVREVPPITLGAEPSFGPARHIIDRIERRFAGLDRRLIILDGDRPLTAVVTTRRRRDQDSLIVVDDRVADPASG
jgi:hypothetical protein